MADENRFIDMLRGLSKNIKQTSKDASDWFRTFVKDFRTKTKIKTFTSTKGPVAGQMYFFNYDAKYKDVLPYFDMYPLVFPIKFTDKGFLGVNLHYLPPNERLGILAFMDSIRTNDKYDEPQKMIQQQRFLESFYNNTRYKVCVKRYLWGHVIGRNFSYVDPNDWAYVALLPFEQWSYNKTYNGKRPPY
jgi:hypothetical protein